MRPILLLLLLATMTVVNAQPYKLYGLTANGGANGLGVMYSLLSDGSNYQLLYSFGAGADGARPYGGLTIALGSKLFGTTRAGGSMGKGTIFSFDTLTNVYTKLADFTGVNGASSFRGLDLLQWDAVWGSPAWRRGQWWDGVCI